MAENITVNMENLTEEEREQLLALIKKSNEPACGIWKPKYNEPYWLIGNDGSTIRTLYKGIPDEKRVKIGNCFRTEEETEFEIERLKVTRELKELAGGYEWSLDNLNYYIVIEYFSGICEISISCYKLTYSNDIFFPSKEAAKKAIKTIGEERLKKYYFGIDA